MIAYTIIDIIIVLVLVFCAWRGAKKGLILTLFGLLGLVVAFFGARLVSTAFYEPVADIIEPGIYQSVKELEEETVLDAGLNVDLDSSLDGLVEMLREQGVFPGLLDILDNAMANEELTETKSRSSAESLSEYLSALAARLVLFVLSFLVILLLWFLISRALDLAFKVPILRTVNTIGGLVLGLLKAAVVVIVLVWFGQLVGWIPAEPPTPVLSLFTPGGISGLLNRLVA